MLNGAGGVERLDSGNIDVKGLALVCYQAAQFLLLTLRAPYVPAIVQAESLGISRFPSLEPTVVSGYFHLRSEFVEGLLR